jgi:hypothetical protein
MQEKIKGKNTPEKIASPPVLEIGLVCSDLLLGLSGILIKESCDIKHLIKKNVTKNERNGEKK